MEVAILWEMQINHTDGFGNTMETYNTKCMVTQFKIHVWSGKTVNVMNLKQTGNVNQVIS